ncbi:hypothetical protein BRC87_08510 [Halobacteriales archaeon QS_4_66_20]|nr:MAG: hypothetical protein BRC87_08510 [Halobacteriales archaeon QS_4_66_20]
MHMVIYALVEASMHDDALATGKTMFDRLVGADPHAGAVFDYYVTFDEEIMRDEDLARHAFHQVGAYDGPTIFLDNQYANGIRHREQLDRLLEESEEFWIVPADVHF